MGGIAFSYSHCKASAFGWQLKTLFICRKTKPMAKKNKIVEKSGYDPDADKALREMIDKAKAGNAALRKILNSLEKKSNKSKLS